MHKIKVSEPLSSWLAEPISVWYNDGGLMICNHADEQTVYVDRDGEVYDTKPHDSVWVGEEVECATCGAYWDTVTQNWQGGEVKDTQFEQDLRQIHKTNKFFSDFQDGKYER